MTFDWSNATVGDFVELQRGNTYKSELLDSPGPVLLGLASIERDGGFRADRLRTYGGDSPAKLLVYPGDMYVSLKDVTQSGDLLGSIARVPVAIRVGRMTQDTVKLIFKNALIEPSYLYWVLRSPEYREYCRSRSMGTTNLSMSRDDFLTFPVPEPTATRISIQQSLDAIESKIDLNRHVSQTLEAIAQTLFKSWFVDFDPVKAKITAKAEGRDPLRAAMVTISGKPDAQLDTLPREQFDQLATTAALFPAEMGESELGEIPKGWRVKTLMDVARFASGKVDVASLDTSTYISTENMLENRGGVIEASSLPSTVTVPGFSIGQVLVSNIRPYFKKLWLARFDGGRSNDVLAFQSHDAECSEFLFNLLYQDQFFEFMTRTSKGAKMPRGDKDAIAAWKFVCADDALLKHFSEKVRPNYQYIDGLSKQSRLLSTARDVLLPKLLSGELQVQNIKAEAIA